MILTYQSRGLCDNVTFWTFSKAIEGSQDRNHGTTSPRNRHVRPWPLWQLILCYTKDWHCRFCSLSLYWDIPRLGGHHFGLALMLLLRTLHNVTRPCHMWLSLQNCIRFCVFEHVVLKEICSVNSLSFICRNITIRVNECREKWLRHDEIRLSKTYPYLIIQQDNFVLMSTWKHTTLAKICNTSHYLCQCIP